MKILITGICGFVGSTLARAWTAAGAGHSLYGVDNFIRPGSETNRAALKKLGVHVLHADLRVASDFEMLPKVDWVIDAAANPSVLAGVDGQSSSRQVVEHNLVGTLNMLEFCRLHRAGFILLSTSRVYAVKPLAALPVQVVDEAFRPEKSASFPPGVSEAGVNEAFSTAPPVSLYGATKVASETLALEYGALFDFPVWINRCGVLAGAGQFGHAEQGIFSFWIHSWIQKRPLKYIGFGGTGHQVRDGLHPRDLLPVLERQIQFSGKPEQHTFNLAGGIENCMSLAQLSRWCRDRFGPQEVRAESQERTFDVPWMVLDCSRARAIWNWKPALRLESVLEEIADFAQRNPQWLEISAIN